MNYTERQVIFNTTRLVTSLIPGQSITREQLVSTLQEPLPKFENGQYYPPDNQIIGNFIFYVLRGSIGYPLDIVTYSEAARLGDTTEEAVRQAASRGRLTQRNVFRYGRVRTGVTLDSLAEYKGWDHDTLKAAAEQVAEWYKS